MTATRALHPTPDSELVLPSAAPRMAWLIARQKGITATDIVKIVGLSAYGNALDTYIDKRCVAIDEPASEAAEWGQILEEPVARKWAEMHHARVRRVGLLRHRKHRHHLASCDRLVSGWNSPLEVKTKSAFVADKWTDGPPDPVIAQTQWQLHVTGCQRAHVAALVGGQRLESFVVERDQDLIDYLVSEADRVWAAVRAGQPPQVDPWMLTGESLDRLHPNRAGRIEVDAAMALPLLDQYREASAQEREAAAAKKQIRLQLVEALGDAEEAEVAGRLAYTYRPSTRRHIDFDRLAEVVPEAAGLIKHRQERRFLLKGGKSA